jgi:asparagine synthase (glutamine-hydrolysing)
MCGIAGIFAYHNAATPVDRGELRAIRDHMAARGPDGMGEWYSENNRIGLGHRRLSIIDLSDRAAQPMASSDGQLVVSFNGEIYNYRQLKKELESRGRVFRTESDTEVLLHLYAEKGAAMLHDLRGMFAFALWDSRKNAMLLARDPYGIKPLYYADDGKTFRFASQVKALLAGGKIDTTPEPAGHAGFFLWGSVPAPWTLYRGIRNLTAGHFLWVTENGAGQLTPYCLVADILANATANPAQGSQREALEVIGAGIRDSIQAHRVSDVPVGMFLSAGLDSAMITALATEHGERPHTLTLAFAEYSGTENDEAPMAERLAAKLGTRHATLMVRRADFEEDREKLFAAMDQPTIDGANTWFVARAAAAQGIKVALSGVGGDELFASYPSFSDLPRITRLARPFSHAPGLGKRLRQIAAPLLSRRASPKYAGLLEYGGSLGGAYMLRRGLYMPWELSKVMDPDMAHQGWQDLQTLEQLNQTVHRSPLTVHPNHRSQLTVHSSRLSVSALEMSWYMRHQLLSDTDWTGMAHSLEIRTPFVDISLLRTLAPWLAAHPGLTKSGIAAAIAPQLPSELLNKPKTGFSIPVRDWLMTDQPVQQERGLRGWARFIHEKLYV